jgi:acetylornithine deacetylase
VTELERRADAAVEARRDTAEAFLAQLVAAPTVLGRERPGQLLVARRLKAMGLAATVRDIDADRLRRLPGFAPVGHSYVSRPNVTAESEGTGGGRSLVLNGHIDVVSPEPVSWWSQDPWGGRIVGRRMYGRGAWDMKGGLVAALWALEAVREAEVPLRGTVRFESVIEEECTGNGTFAARTDAPPADGAVIPECTGLEAFTSTPVVLWVEIKVRGWPAYVGRPGEYVNAIERAVGLIARLREIATGHASAGLTFSVGTIRGGDWASTVPLECSFVCRLSAPREWPVEQARQLVEGWIVAAAAVDPWLRDHAPQVSYPGFQAAGWAIEPAAEIVAALDDAHGSIVGGRLSQVHFPGTADGRYFAARGEPAIYYGPNGGNQHAPDEYVDLDSVLLVARVLARLIVAWCS